ncbi:hypothetical protein NE237_014776 [Protea cynaroides]|uniref:Uncharacterized protein n=1 Tax=Protea cynaroides TaxID=273540 RepID=A0A9Q0KCS0_9MAGN|nr:hypothetical protein NE237_014776 [Protea cynaroides]
MVVLGGSTMAKRDGLDGSRITTFERLTIDLGKFLGFPPQNIYNPNLGNTIGGNNAGKEKNLKKDKRKYVCASIHNVSIGVPSGVHNHVDPILSNQECMALGQIPTDQTGPAGRSFVEVEMEIGGHTLTRSLLGISLEDNTFYSNKLWNMKNVLFIAKNQVGSNKEGEETKRQPIVEEVKRPTIDGNGTDLGVVSGIPLGRWTDVTEDKDTKNDDNDGSYDDEEVEDKEEGEIRSTKEGVSNAVGQPNAVAT